MVVPVKYGHIIGLRGADMRDKHKQFRFLFHAPNYSHTNRLGFRSRRKIHIVLPICMRFYWYRLLNKGLRLFMIILNEKKPVIKLNGTVNESPTGTRLKRIELPESITLESRNEVFRCNGNSKNPQ